MNSTYTSDLRIFPKGWEIPTDDFAFELADRPEDQQEALLAVLRGEVEKLGKAFTWRFTPQGWSHWFERARRDHQLTYEDFTFLVQLFNARQEYLNSRPKVFSEDALDLLGKAASAHREHNHDATGKRLLSALRADPRVWDLFDNVEAELLDLLSGTPLYARNATILGRYLREDG